MSSSLENEKYELTRQNGLWHVLQKGTSLWGQGDTLQAAYDDFEKRQSDYLKFSKESGLEAFEMEVLEKKTSTFLKNSLGFVRIVAIVSLCSIPLSYAVSSAITRTLHEVRFAIAPSVLDKLENKIIEIGNQEGNISPERMEELSKAIENIVQTVRPLTSSLPLLLEPETDKEAKDGN